MIREQRATSIWYIIFFVWVSLYSAQSARSEPTKAAARAMAQDEFMKGYQLLKSRKVKEGIRSLRSAYRIYPSPEILVLLGTVYDRFPQGCGRAIATWKRLVDTCDKTCSSRQEALTKLKRAEADCAVSLTIESEPPNAEVFLRDQPQGTTPLELSIHQARALELTLLKPGYQTLNHTVKLLRKTPRHTAKVKLDRVLGSGLMRGSNSETSGSSTQPKSTGQRTAAPPADPPSRSAPISSPFGPYENPFVRLKKPAPITQGKIAQLGDLSMLSDLRCEYRTRFKHYVALSRCDGMMLTMNDRFYIALHLQQDAYVYMVVSNQRGQWQLVFPAPMEDALIRAGQLATIPNKEWVVLDHIEDTTEEISILASPKPIPILERQRSTPELGEIPLALKRYFVPMAEAYRGQIQSAAVLNRHVDELKERPQILHTSYRIHK